MARILVSSLINLETTLRVDGFPIEYMPVRYPFYRVNSSVAGVGFNVARALTGLGNGVRFLSLIGRDPAGSLVKTVMDLASMFASYKSGEPGAADGFLDEASLNTLYASLSK